MTAITAAEVIQLLQMGVNCKSPTTIDADEARLLLAEIVRLRNVEGTATLEINQLRLALTLIKNGRPSPEEFAALVLGGNWLDKINRVALYGVVVEPKPQSAPPASSVEPGQSHE